MNTIIKTNKIEIKTTKKKLIVIKYNKEDKFTVHTVNTVLT